EPCLPALVSALREELTGTGDQPMADAQQARVAPTPEAAAVVSPLDHLPPRSTGDEHYIFVSYKREDMPRIKPHLERIVGWGYKIWYDASIPGGAGWQKFIAEKVADCQLMLLFLSRAAMGSKWVRREIMFADRRNKAVLTVLLEPLSLAEDTEMD